MIISNSSQQLSPALINQHGLISGATLKRKWSGRRHIVLIKIYKDCWIWTGWAPKNGYPRVIIPGTKKFVSVTHLVLAARLSRPLLPKMRACHTCDNTLCVNPDHLFEGSQRDNINDCIEKGRFNRPKGENHVHAKLTENNVLEIKKLISLGVLHKVIAKKFNVGKTIISNIRTGKKWKHVGNCKE